MKWIKDLMPDDKQLNGMQRSMITLRDSFKNSVELDPRLKQLGEDKMAEWRRWFDTRLDDAIEAASTTSAAGSGDQVSRKYADMVRSNLHSVPKVFGQSR